MIEIKDKNVNASLAKSKLTINLLKLLSLIKNLVYLTFF